MCGGAGGPNSQRTSDATQFWDTIRRAEVSFHRQDRASRRFHEAKRRVDQTLRHLSDAKGEDCVIQHRHHSPDGDDQESFDQGKVQDQNLDLPDSSSINPCGTRHTHDINSDIVTSGGDDAEVTRQREAHDEIAPIIDAMESRAARVEQLVEEMEFLLLDVKRLLDEMEDHNAPNSKSRLR